MYVKKEEAWLTVVAANIVYNRSIHKKQKSMPSIVCTQTFVQYLDE